VCSEKEFVAEKSKKPRQYCRGFCMDTASHVSWHINIHIDGHVSWHTKQITALLTKKPTSTQPPFLLLSFPNETDP